MTNDVSNYVDANNHISTSLHNKALPKLSAILNTLEMLYLLNKITEEADIE